jgi:hypothetical protein
MALLRPHTALLLAALAIAESLIVAQGAPRSAPAQRRAAAARRCQPAHARSA